MTCAGGVHVAVDVSTGKCHACGHEVYRMTTLSTSTAKARIVRAIAESLIESVCLEQGIPMLPWDERTDAQKARFIHLAEVAIHSTDPMLKCDLRDKAIANTLDWLNGPGEYPGVSTETVIREAITQYMKLENA